MGSDALRGLVAPLDCQADWQRTVDELHEPDLEIEEDPAAAAGLLRKRPDGFALNWGSKNVLILEFTRAYEATTGVPHGTQPWTASRQTVASLSETNSRVVSLLDGL